MAKQDWWPFLFDSPGCAVRIFSGDDTWQTLKKMPWRTINTHQKCSLSAKPRKAVPLWVSFQIWSHTSGSRKTFLFIDMLVTTGIPSPGCVSFYSFIQQILIWLRICGMPGTVLSAEDTAMNSSGRVPAFMELHGGGGTLKIGMKMNKNSFWKLLRNKQLPIKSYEENKAGLCAGTCLGNCLNWLVRDKLSEEVMFKLRFEWQ